MSNRAAKFGSAIFASILAGANLTAISNNASGADDTCLTAPKESTPAGSHWYYRVDHATKRQCWYLGEEKEAAARAAPQPTADSAKPASSEPARPVAPPKAARPRRLIDDARAELPSSKMPVDRDTNPVANQRNRAAPNPPNAENSPRMVAPDASGAAAAVGVRWPEPSAVNSSINPSPAATAPVAVAQSGSEPPPQPAVPPVTLAAADSTLQKPSGSVQMLLLVIVGALGLVGLLGNFIFKRVHRRKARATRRAIWDSVDNNRSPAPRFPREQMPPRRMKPAPHPAPHYARERATDYPREPRAAEISERQFSERQISEMLSRLARSTAN